MNHGRDSPWRDSVNVRGYVSRHANNNVSAVENPSSERCINNALDCFEHPWVLDDWIVLHDDEWNPEAFCSPTGPPALDFDGQKHVAQLLTEIPATLLVVTHERAVAGKCDRVFEMAGGVLREAGSL